MKLTLTDLVSLANETSAVQTINDNFAALETAFENTLSRDGTAPNYFSANVDMNSKRITNLPTPTANSDAATKGYVDTLVGGMDQATLEEAIAAAPAALASQVAAEAAADSAEASAILASQYVGSATSAAKWSTPRTITFSGVSTSASPAWDGSTDLTISLALVDGAVTLTKLETIGIGLLGSSTGGSVGALTPTVATSVLNTFTTSTKGLVPGPTVGDVSKFLRGDGTWASPTSSNFDLSTSTIGASGILRLGTLKIMWGRYAGGASGPTITFPEAFTTAVYNIQLTAEGTGADTDSSSESVKHVSVMNGSVGLTNFRVYCSAENGGTDVYKASIAVPFYWIAIGV